jgi:membrane protein CcdC involved in cytochrome C biogenesis
MRGKPKQKKDLHLCPFNIISGYLEFTAEFFIMSSVRTEHWNNQKGEHSEMVILLFFSFIIGTYACLWNVYHKFQGELVNIEKLFVYYQ